MKVLSVVFLALPVAAFGRTQFVPTLPSPEFADTEVSACHPLFAGVLLPGVQS